MAGGKRKAAAVGDSPGSATPPAGATPPPTTDDRETKDNLRKSARAAARATDGAAAASAASVPSTSDAPVSIDGYWQIESHTPASSAAAATPAATGGGQRRALVIRKPPALPLVKPRGKATARAAAGRGKGKGPATGALPSVGGLPSFTVSGLAAAAAAAAAASASACSWDGQPAAPYVPTVPVNLVVDVGGSPQYLSPAERELNIQAEFLPEKAVAAPTPVTSSAVSGARRKAPATRKLSALPVAKPGGKSMARAAVVRGRSKGLATGTPPPAANAGTAAAAAAAASPLSVPVATDGPAGPAAPAVPATAAATATLSAAMLSAVQTGVNPLVADIAHAVSAVNKIQGDLDALREVVDTHGVSLGEVRNEVGASKAQLSEGIAALLGKAKEPVTPQVKEEVVADLEGFQLIERVRARLRKTLAEKLGFSNTSDDAIPDKETFRDLIALATQDELNLDEAAAQAWLTTPVATPSRGGGGTPLFVRPLVPLLRVRGHFLQALKKRVNQVYFPAVNISLATVTPGTAALWKYGDKYMASTLGRKGIVAATSATLVAVGAGSRIIQPTAVGDEVVVETTVAVVSLVGAFVRAALDEADNSAGTHNVGDNLLEKLAAEQARFEEHWVMDDGVHHGIRLVDGAAEQ